MRHLFSPAREFVTQCTTEFMPKNPMRMPQPRFASIDSFVPWWVKCDKCSRVAMLWPECQKKSAGKVRCDRCGTVRTLPGNEGGAHFVHRRFPLVLRSDFCNHVFWALNPDHLQFLEVSIAAQLRERPVVDGKRLKFTRQMPFDLPAWLLAAKNREDLLRLIKKLRRDHRIPKPEPPVSS